MKQIKIKTPAKINLTLEVLNKRQDGFHNIQTIMQSVSLYDYLTIKVEHSNVNKILLSGNSSEIPYDEHNIIFKASKLFLKENNLKNYKIDIYIEKNIPVAAGLAGGSSNGAGTLYGLNILFDNLLSRDELHKLCAKLGSDLNFCLEGGCALCEGRGEKITKLPVVKMPVTLIKPTNIGISAKEAYTKFSLLPTSTKKINNCTKKLQNALIKNKFDATTLFNSLELAVINDYEELKEIKNKISCSIMSGSGSTFFVLSENIDKEFFNDKYQIIENLIFTTNGVQEF